MSIWYKAHKLLELNDKFQSLKSSKKCFCQSCNTQQQKANEAAESVQRLIDLIPTSCNAGIIPPMNQSKAVTTQVGNAQKESANLLVESYCEAITSRYEFAVESSIGRIQLKSSIKRLKKCCELQSSDPNNPTLKLEWIKALKEYRSLYNGLVKVSKCTFIDKIS